MPCFQPQWHVLLETWTVRFAYLTTKCVIAHISAGIIWSWGTLCLTTVVQKHTSWPCLPQKNTWKNSLSIWNNHSGRARILVIYSEVKLTFNHNQKRGKKRKKLRCFCNVRAWSVLTAELTCSCFCWLKFDEVPGKILHLCNLRTHMVTLWSSSSA